MKRFYKVLHPFALILISIKCSITRRRKYELILLVLLMICSGLAESLSIGLFIPFLTLITSPSFELPSFIASLLNSSNIEFAISHPKIAAAALLGISSLIAACIRIYTLYKSNHIAAKIGTDISFKLFSNVVTQPYSFMNSNNSTHVINSISTHVPRVVQGVIDLLKLIYSSVLAISIVMTLTLVNSAALLLILALAIIYFVAVFLTVNKFNRYSDIIATSSQSQLQLVDECLAARRDLILQNKISGVAQKYLNLDISQRVHLARIIILSLFPRYALEGISLFSLSLVVLVYIALEKDLSSLLPIMGSFAIGLQKLLPSIQQIYNSASSLNGFSANISEVNKLLSLPKNYFSYDCFPRDFKSIELQNISFRHPSSEFYIIQNLSFEIKPEQVIGICGPSGSGKSTLMDLLTGLLKPVSGNYLINGKVFENNSKHVCNISPYFAHVPQDPTFVDGSIIENICLYDDHSFIDKSRVVLACKRANIYSFIMSLPNQFDFNIGQNGSKLSGGQKQRLAIARALYKKAEILIFDEATSALDSTTKNEVLSSISSLRKFCAIILVTHDLNDLKYCSKSFLIQEGSLIKFSS